MARLAISLDESLAREIRRAAGDQALSAWLAEAARRRLRAEGLREVVAEWEAQNGEITDAEQRSVERSWRSRRSK
ncbi:MAG: hypothetical protein HYV07_07350 [Deltaproteobacteria bacterium]|nr:hypothetical protein [Deltaproteobacteria bacterium]